MHYKPFFTPKVIAFLAVGCVLAACLIGGCIWAVTGHPEPEASAPAPTATTTQTPTTTTTMGTTETQAPTTTAAPTTAAPEKFLEVRSHKRTDITVRQPYTHFYGTSDPTQPLTLNGQPVERSAQGDFSFEQKLEPGTNRFTFSHKGKESTYIVRYRFVMVESYAPKDAQTYDSGAAFAVRVKARTGSRVTASFQGKTLTLAPTTDQGDGHDTPSDDTYTLYTGSFRLPDDNVKDQNMGTVDFTVCYEGRTETYRSGTITCRKAKMPVIGEILAFSAETFDGGSSDDLSRPVNNYLPRGTVDYVTGHAYNGSKEYLILRCGRRVYTNIKDTDGVSAVSKEYPGKLPEHNTLQVASVKTDARHTVLTLDTQWKAPFLLDLKPQEYHNPRWQDYSVDEVTAAYAEITFCYASSFTGQLDFGDSHPLFSSAEVLQDKDSYRLRLHFKKPGAFYGWDASYNDKGQLVFSFLHPAQVKPAENLCGADLTGVTVLVDVGHGGKESGTYSLEENFYEKDANLVLANELTRLLRQCGATVIQDRTTDVSIPAWKRCQDLISARPDICISVHHDGSHSSKPNGFGSFHSTLFAQPAAKFVYNRTMGAGIYDENATHSRLKWHFFFLARMTVCPVVLTENGYMTNLGDFETIKDPATVHKKAAAIAAGVGDYFLSIRQEGVQPPTAPTQSETTGSDSTATGSTAATGSAATTGTTAALPATTATLSRPTVENPAPGKK